MDKLDTKKVSKQIIKKQYGTGNPSRAIIGAIVGALAALWLCQIAYAIIGRTANLLFIAFPMFICGAIILFKGGGRRLSIVLTVVLSVVGALLIPAAELAVDHVVKYDMFFLNAIPITLLMTSDSAVISNIAFNSAYVFPVVFIAIGSFIAWELFKYRISPYEKDDGICGGFEENDGNVVINDIGDDSAGNDSTDETVGDAGNNDSGEKADDADNSKDTKE